MLQLGFLLAVVALVPLLDSKETENSRFVLSDSSLPWNLRLPGTVKPVHYDLLIHPNLTFLNFTGSVQIQLDVQQDTKFVFLHSKNLHISKAVALQSDGAHVLYVHQSEPFEQIALSSQKFTFIQGAHVIRLDFSANLSDSFHGFYKGSYATRSGEVRYVFIEHLISLYLFMGSVLCGRLVLVMA